MSTNESHKIDELFRDELSNYTVPVTVTAAPLLAVAAKKGLFYKIAALLKVNTITLVAGTATITSVATVATVKIIEHYQKKNNAAVQQTKTTVKSKVIPQQLFADTLKQISSQATLNATAVALQSQNTESQNKAVKPTPFSKNDKKEVLKTIETVSQTQPTSTIEQTQTVNVAPTSIAKNETVSTIVKDTVQKTTTAARKVVYVKQKPVIVQDTVVKVIKKVRPKKE
jgi:uncharacterized protein YdiU (UPF0061 family)